MISKIFISILSLFLFSACALPRQDPPRDADEARRVWQRFTARDNAAETGAGPFRIAGTLRYTDADGHSTRVSSLLWGNGDPGSPYPLRLDLIAGVGNVVAKIHETESSFLAYVPDDNTAYVRSRDLYTLLAFGVPIPLTLGDLTLLLTGRGGALFLSENNGGATALPERHSATEAGFSYVITQAILPGILELSPTGALLSWREERADGWRIQFEPSTDNPAILRRLRIEHAAGHSALIVIREFERLPEAFSPGQLALSLPRDATIRELEE
ncbi:MAG: hypothetical protein LBP61_04280 [Desulfovibrio sp.]|jgi:outer membrane biogenesis lipoprotein LolB|nr:hypothetical protein [Desulfovibrio sp.]